MMHIVARPRLHLSLADMGYVSSRVFGGIGFAVDAPPTVFQFEQAECVELHGLDALDDEGRNDLFQVAERLKFTQLNCGFRAFLVSAPPQHVGFGSKTSLALSLLAGVNILCACGWSVEEMQRLSGRGGASGIGIHTFFHGGVIWDAGHSLTGAKQLLPSGFAPASELPPLMLRYNFPEPWRVALILPDEKPMSGEEEVHFFSNNAPIPSGEALSTMAALYHGVLPAFLSTDYVALATALREIHNIGFKQRELRRCSVETRTCVGKLFEQGFAAGLSSVGPLIYAIIPKSDDSSLVRVKRISEHMSIRMFAVAEGWNSGYEIRPGSWS
jgi:beta-ribofuranosylaminobenzene 5'-phosphate synthase